MQVIDLLVHYGDLHLFRSAVQQTLRLLKTEKDFRELMLMIAEYYRCLDQEAQEKDIHAFLEKRSKIDLNLPFDPLQKLPLHDLL